MNNCVNTRINHFMFIACAIMSVDMNSGIQRTYDASLGVKRSELVSELAGGPGAAPAPQSRLKQ